MPEGHTIHRLARDQGADLAGRPVAARAVQPRFAAGAARLDGQVLVVAEAWGKHLFHTYDAGDVLHVHLGLIGTWTRRDGEAVDEPGATVRLRLAGIGNVYRSELLNIVGIDPRRPARRVARTEFDDLWRETVRQLRLGVRRNRIVTMRTDELPRPAARLARGEGRYVYKQDRCGRCDTELDVFPLAGRTTWRCPRCQPR